MRFITMTIFVVIANICLARAPYNSVFPQPVKSDSIDYIHTHRNHFWRAAGETVGFNLGLWTFDRYVLKGHYSYISWNSIKENFRHGFEWDNDHLKTNMFDHPYTGALYFNAGRSNGFNFWQSELFAIGGSAMWELFMECEYPSTNDIIATPVGGAAIGEVEYRISDLILDNRSVGVERFGREFAAFIIDPMRGINRVVSGQAWRHRATSGRHFGIPPLKLDVSIGSRQLLMFDDYNIGKCGAAAEIKLEYGERYGEAAKKPYDYYTGLVEVQAISTQPFLSRVEIIGRLLSKDLIEKDKLNLNVGLYQHFDFFDSDTISRSSGTVVSWQPCNVPYKLGTPASVGGGLMMGYRPSKSFTLDGYLHANGIILAGILTDYYRDYNRNYNWGSGFSIKAALKCSFWGERLVVRVADEHYRLYTWSHDIPLYSDWINQTEIAGDISRSWFNHLEFSTDYQLFHRLYATLGLDYYKRNTYYIDRSMTIRPNAWSSNAIIDSHQLGIHLMLTYKL